MKNTHVAVQQKPTQHCKAIMLQPEINLKLNSSKYSSWKSASYRLGEEI